MLIPEIVRPHVNVVVYGNGRPVAELPIFFCLSNAISVRFMLLRILSDSVAAHEAVEQGMVAGNVIVAI